MVGKKSAGNLFPPKKKTQIKEANNSKSTSRVNICLRYCTTAPALYMCHSCSSVCMGLNEKNVWQVNESAHFAIVLVVLKTTKLTSPLRYFFHWKKKKYSLQAVVKARVCVHLQNSKEMFFFCIQFLVYFCFFFLC